MTIKAIAAKNFKSWRDTGQVTLAPLTGLFGSNSSGKTSLIQLILLLKQTVESSDRRLVLQLGDDRSLVDFGTFQDVIYQHDLNRALEWEVEWELPSPLNIARWDEEIQDRSFDVKELRFSAQVFWKSGRNGSSNAGRIAVRKMSYTLDLGEFEAELGMEMKDADEFQLISRPELKRNRGRPPRVSAPMKCYGFPDEVRANYQNASFLSDIVLEFENLFGKRVFYLGPLREYPKRQYVWAGAKPTDVGRKGEGVVEAILASREAGNSYSFGRGRKRKLLEEVLAHWLKEMNLIESFAVRPVKEGSKLYQVWVSRHPGTSEVLITDVGFGVSQVLPVITLLYYVPEGSVVILEQPEIHLHPSVQAGLADVIIDAVRHRKVQVILESHSEHLLRRLQRRIAEEVLEEKQVSLYFCRSNPDGSSSLQRLETDMFGQIHNWPEDFFGDELGEILETQRAILRRQQREA